MEPVHGELPLGGEDVEGAGDHQLKVLVGRQDAPLQVYYESMSRQKVCPQDRLVDICNFEVQAVLPAVEL